MDFVMKDGRFHKEPEDEAFRPSAPSDAADIIHDAAAETVLQRP